MIATLQRVNAGCWKARQIQVRARYTVRHSVLPAAPTILATSSMSATFAMSALEQFQARGCGMAPNQGWCCVAPSGREAPAAFSLAARPACRERHSPTWGRAGRERGEEGGCRFIPRNGTYWMHVNVAYLMQQQSIK